MIHLKLPSYLPHYKYIICITDTQTYITHNNINCQIPPNSPFSCCNGMFSLTQRFQTVSNQAVTYSLCIVAVIVATSWYQLYKENAFFAPAEIENIKPFFRMRSSWYWGSTDGKPKENSRIVFDLDTDLSPLFNWNTKQVFVYLTAEYENDSHMTNELTYWDQIITKKEDAHLQLTEHSAKYWVWDLADRLTGKTLNFKLRWNIQPWIGPLIFGETTGNHTVTFPNEIPEKKRKQVNKKNQRQQHAAKAA